MNINKKLEEIIAQQQTVIKLIAEDNDITINESLIESINETIEEFEDFIEIEQSSQQRVNQLRYNTADRYYKMLSSFSDY